MEKLRREKSCLKGMLQKLVELDGSDLHLTNNSPPCVRVHGRLTALDHPSLGPEATKRLAYSVMTEAQISRFEAALEIDFSFGVEDLARFRANVFTQRGSIAAVFRAIPLTIKRLEELRLPSIIGSFCDKPRGLVLITGPTGSGKSTTLAALVDKINRYRRQHIVTIEDPIEFLHPHKGCLVNQREVMTDTSSFAAALRVVLREDPDVVMIGEMRDLETMESALRVAETGHLTLATLHTNSAVSTINRIIDVFPPHHQQQIRAQLSLVLEGIVCQALIPLSAGKGRVPATEVLVPNMAVRSLIRENKLHQIYSCMQSGRAVHGMHTMNQSLAGLVNRRLATYEDCLGQSPNPEELRAILQRSRAEAVGDPPSPDF